jgi:hypothetical protein
MDEGIDGVFDGMLRFGEQWALDWFEGPVVAIVVSDGEFLDWGGVCLLRASPRSALRRG